MEEENRKSKGQKRERFQKVGSVRYEEDKTRLIARTRKGLFLTMDALTRKLEAGKPLRDEEIRFLKTFGSTLAVLEEREQDVEENEETGLPEGRLKEYIEQLLQFKEATGIMDPRRDGLDVMNRSGYYLCGFCREFHKTLDHCPFKPDEKKKEVV
jgi:hypothetical protein